MPKHMMPKPTRAGFPTRRRGGWRPVRGSVGGLGGGLLVGQQGVPKYRVPHPSSSLPLPWHQKRQPSSAPPSLTLKWWRQSTPPTSELMAPFVPAPAIESEREGQRVGVRITPAQSPGSRCKDQGDKKGIPRSADDAAGGVKGEGDQRFLAGYGSARRRGEEPHQRFLYGYGAASGGKRRVDTYHPPCLCCHMR